MLAGQLGLDLGIVGIPQKIEINVTVGINAHYHNKNLSLISSVCEIPI